MFGPLSQADRWCTSRVKENGTPAMKLLLAQNKVGYKALLTPSNTTVFSRFVNEKDDCLMRTDNVVREDNAVSMFLIFFLKKKKKQQTLIKLVASSLTDAFFNPPLKNQIIAMENGSLYVETSRTFVSSGMFANGTSYRHRYPQFNFDCHSWTSGSSFQRVGRMFAVNSSWIADCEYINTHTYIV